MLPGLLAFDLDGTIAESVSEPGPAPAADPLANEQTLVPGLLEELAHWRQAGWKVAVITARARTPGFIAPLRADAVSRMYGAHLCVGGQETARYSLPAAVVEQALALLTPSDLDFAVGKTMVLGADRAQGWWNGPPHPGFSLHPAQVPQVLKVYHGQADVTRVDEVEAAWAALPGGQVIREHAGVVALVARGADKGSAVQRLAQAFGLPPERVLALGDGYSDAAMLRAAGAFVRVGQHPALRAARFHAAQPRDVPGVLAALRRAGQNWQNW